MKPTLNILWINHFKILTQMSLRCSETFVKDWTLVEPNIASIHVICSENMIRIRGKLSFVNAALTNKVSRVVVGLIYQLFYTICRIFYFSTNATSEFKPGKPGITWCKPWKTNQNQYFEKPSSWKIYSLEKSTLSEIQV